MVEPEPAVPLPKRKRGSAWKFVGVVLGVLALLLGAAGLWIRSVADRRWAAMEAETRRLAAETLARDSSRPVLRGEPVEGNAWDDYAVALKEYRNLRASSSVLGEFVSRGPKSDRKAVEAVIAAHPAVLDALRRGARRGRSRSPMDWEHADTTNLLPAQVVGSFAVCQARLLAEAGRAREAAELLLDTCQFARDVGHDSLLISEMIALAVYGMAIEELRDLVLSGRLTAADLRQAGRELETVDREFPRTTLTLANETAFIGYFFLKGGEEEFMGVKAAEVAMTSWRYGFSARLMQVDAFDRWREPLRLAGDLDGKPWRDLITLSDRQDDAIGRIKNPWVGSQSRFRFCIRPGRQKRAQLRLVRVAAHYRATGEVLDLDDPFGGKLLTQRTGGTLKVWSVGPDGTDNGGVGDFRGAAKGPASDIVLEVERD